MLARAADAGFRACISASYKFHTLFICSPVIGSTRSKYVGTKFDLPVNAILSYLTVWRRLTADDLA